MQHGEPGPSESPETTHLNAVDEQGNAVALTYTINGSYGNGVTVPRLGFLLNNEMDDFAAKPGEPNMFGLVQGEANAIQPRKRPLSSMTPAIVLKDGRLFLVAGAPGGSRIITGVTQVVLNVIDFKMTVQQAVDQPRFHHQWKPDKLYLERGFSPDTQLLLRQRGHQLEEIYGVASVEAILVDGGWLQGAQNGRYGGQGRRILTYPMQHVLSTHLIVQHRLNTVWLERIWERASPPSELFCARQHFDYRNKAQVSELGYWFRDSELKLHALHSPMFNDDCWGRTGPSSVVNITEPSKPRRLECVDEIKRALEVAEKIPFRYLIQHIGVKGEEWTEQKVDAAFSALEEIMLFASNRGVKVLLENIPNQLSSADRLLNFLELTHLDLDFCFDTGHAHMNEGVEAAFALMQHRIRSTHVHDNNGVDDIHLSPALAGGGTIDWRKTMELLRSRPGQYPLVLELREEEGTPPLDTARRVFETLENL